MHVNISQCIFYFCGPSLRLHDNLFAVLSWYAIGMHILNSIMCVDVSANCFGPSRAHRAALHPDLSMQDLDR